MQDFNPVCNFTKCRKTLTKIAWITSCSHNFCEEHGNNVVTQGDEIKKCPACGMLLNDQYDLLRTDLNPPEQFKSMIIAGLRPEIIMDIASRALLFWSYQVCQEHFYLEVAYKSAQERTQIMTDYFENMSVKQKADKQKTQRKVEALENEIKTLQKRIEELVQQLAEKTRNIMKIQSQYELMRRNSVVGAIPTEFSNKNSPMKSIYNDMINSKIQNIEMGPGDFGRPCCSGENIESRRYPHMHPFENQRPIHHNMINQQQNLANQNMFRSSPMFTGQGKSQENVRIE